MTLWTHIRPADEDLHGLYLSSYYSYRENSNKRVSDGKVRFHSGLILSKEDGRVRQGDVVTTYKSQGASKLDIIRFEDNQSLRAMAGQEDLHVGFTRHRVTAKMFVESIEVLQEIASRSQRNVPTAATLRESALLSMASERTLANGMSPQIASFINADGLELRNAHFKRSLRSESRNGIKRHPLIPNRPYRQGPTSAGIQDVRI